MSDIELLDASSGYNLGLINYNFNLIEETINTSVLHRKGGNNTMDQTLDMNGYRIINVGGIHGEDSGSFITLNDVDIPDDYEGVGGYLLRVKFDQTGVEAYTGDVIHSLDSSAPGVYAISHGGRRNLSEGANSVIIGGADNTNSPGATFSSILGGLVNTVTGGFSSIIGGQQNLVTSNHSTVVSSSGITETRDYRLSMGSGGNINISLDADNGVVEVLGKDIQLLNMRDMDSSGNILPEDKSNAVIHTSAEPHTYTIPLSLNQVGFMFSVFNVGEGEVTVQGGAGVTLTLAGDVDGEGPVTIPEASTATFVQVQENDWCVMVVSPLDVPIDDIEGLRAALDSKANNSVEVVAGQGLTGGGDLTEDVTLSVAFGDTANKAAQGNDPRLSDSREWSAPTVTQTEAEEGTDTERKAWTAQRVRQAIAGWWNTYSSTVGKSLATIANPDTISWLRINSDNTVSTRTTEEVQEELGIPVRKDNLSATTDPTEDDDETEGYTVLSKWVNTNSGEVFVLVNAQEGNANWQHNTLTLDDLSNLAVTNASTTGLSLVQVPVPGSDSYLRANSDGTVESRSPAQMRTDLDAVGNNDTRLSDAREWTASTVSQAEAEVGTSTTRRAWTSQRVRQAISSWWSNIDLGLGTAAEMDVTTYSTDTTDNRILKVADFGLGSSSSSNLITVADLNDPPTASGFYGVSYFNTANNFTEASSTLVVSKSFSGRTNYILQTEDGDFYTNARNQGGDLQDWVQMWTDSNLDPENILGTRVNQQDLNVKNSDGFSYTFLNDAINAPPYAEFSSGETRGWCLDLATSQSSSFAQIFAHFDQNELSFRRRATESWEKIWHTGNFNPENLRVSSNNIDYDYTNLASSGTTIVSSNHMGSTLLGFGVHYEFRPSDATIPIGSRVDIVTGGTTGELRATSGQTVFFQRVGEVPTPNPVILEPLSYYRLIKVLENTWMVALYANPDIQDISSYTAFVNPGGDFNPNQSDVYCSRIGNSVNIYIRSLFALSSGSSHSSNSIIPSEFRPSSHAVRTIAEDTSGNLVRLTVNLNGVLSLAARDWSGDPNTMTLTDWSISYVISDGIS